MGMSNDKAAQLLAGLNAPRMVSMTDASKGLQLGIQSFRNQQAEEGKRQSMAMANEYVSNLLGKGDAESIKQSRTMLPYADKQFAEQAQYMVHDIERGQDVAHRDAVFQETKEQNLIKNDQFQKTYEQTDRLAQEKNKLQLKLAQMQEAGANFRNKLSVAAQMAGIDKQIRAQKMQLDRMDKKAEIEARAANLKYRRSLVSTIDPIKSAELSMSRHGTPDFLLDTSDFVNNASYAKSLLGVMADDPNVSADQLAGFVNMVNSGRSLDLLKALKAK